MADKFDEDKVPPGAEEGGKEDRYLRKATASVDGTRVLCCHASLLKNKNKRETEGGRELLTAQSAPPLGMSVSAHELRLPIAGRPLRCDNRVTMGEGERGWSLS